MIGSNWKFFDASSGFPTILSIWLVNNLTRVSKWNILGLYFPGSHIVLPMGDKGKTTVMIHTKYSELPWGTTN